MNCQAIVIGIMNIAMLDLELLHTFVAVVEAGGFTRAAARIHRTQSTISQQIRRLEEDVGCQLLHRDRTKGSLALTDQGEIFLGYARRLISLSKDAREAMRRPNATAIVRLGVPEDFAVGKLTSLLSGFACEFPQIRLDTTSAWTGELRRLLDEGELDLSLIKRDAGEGRCLARWPERLAWVAGRGFDPAGDPVPLALFPQGCIYRRRAVETIETLGRSWRVAYVGQGLAGVQAAVSSGIGISLLATDTVPDDHRRLGREDGFPDPAPTELALLAGNNRPRDAVSTLIAYLKTNIGAPMN